MKLDIKCKQSFLILPLLMAAGFAQMPPARAIMQTAMPNSLKVPEGKMLDIKVRARGVQIYECKVADNPEKFQWTLLGPEAILFNNQGKKIGKHYAGPTWEADDGSSVVGTVEASAKKNPRAIPWLLLQGTSNNGNGIFSNVTYIQRLDTVGGVAPAKGCDRAHTGNEVRVKYRANYLFYTRPD